MTRELREKIVRLRDTAVNPTVDDKAVASAREFLRQVRALNNRLRVLVETEGLCVAKR